MSCMSYIFIYYKNHTRNFPGGDTFLLGDVGGDRLDAGNNLRKTLKNVYIFKRDVLYKPQENLVDLPTHKLNTGGNVPLPHFTKYIIKFIK